VVLKKLKILKAIRVFWIPCSCVYAFLGASNNKVKQTNNCVANCAPRYLSKDHEICFFISSRKSFGFLGPLHLRSACRRRLTSLAQFQNSTLPLRKRLLWRDLKKSMPIFIFQNRTLPLLERLLQRDSVKVPFKCNKHLPIFQLSNKTRRSIKK